MMNKKQVEEVTRGFIEEIIELVLLDVRENNTEYLQLKKEMSNQSEQIDNILNNLSEADRELIDDYMDKQNYIRNFEYYALITFDKKLLLNIFGI